MSEARIMELESQLAQLQRHVEGQDAEMLGLAQRLQRMEAAWKQLRSQLDALAEGEPPSASKPPHY